MATKSFSIRIDETMLDKLHVLADYEGRSANSQVLILIRDAIQAYEKEHAAIPENNNKKRRFHTAAFFCAYKPLRREIFKSVPQAHRNSSLFSIHSSLLSPEAVQG